MSVFDYPRINVAGSYVVDPPTGNNDVPPASWLSDTGDVRAVRGPMDDDQFSAWVTGLNEQGLLRCSWNYYGDMSIRLLDVTVTGVQTGPHEVVTEAAADGLVGGRVSLNDAVMVDVDPEGVDATQIFAGSLQIEAAAALRDRIFVSRPPTRATLRQLNFCRNVSFTSAIGATSSAHAGGGSAIFQFSVDVLAEDLGNGRLTPGAGQQLHRLEALPASPAASALTAVLARPEVRGLVFRLSLYMTHPLLPDPELAAAFASGEGRHNPAYGLVCGTIAPWFTAEPASVTMGRLLRPAGTYPNPARKGAPYELGLAVARHDSGNGQLSVDFVNSLPEDGIAGAKFDLSPLSVGLRAATPAGTDPAANTAPVLPLGTVTNDEATYRTTGGIWDLPLDGLPPSTRSLLDSPDHELVVVGGSKTSAVLLAESEYMVASDCAASYLEQPAAGVDRDDPAAAAPAQGSHAAYSGEVLLHLFRRGRPAAGAVDLVVELWDVHLRSSAAPNVRSAGLLTSETVSVTDGEIRLPLRPPPSPGVYDYRFVPPGWWPATLTSSGFVEETGEDARSMVRVFPAHDYDGLSDEEVTFRLVYDEVLRYYRLVYPAMSQHLDLSDATLWRTPAAARYLTRVIDLSLWATPLAMPRSRDLPGSRRRLLQRFCRLVIEGEMRPEPDGSGGAPTAAPVGPGSVRVAPGGAIPPAPPRVVPTGTPGNGAPAPSAPADAPAGDESARAVREMPR